MHEYGLMESVVNSALGACGDRLASEPTRVRIEVGEFAFASRESLRTAFEVLTQGTPLAGVRLDIAEIPGEAACEACGFQGTAADVGPELADPPALILCPRCGAPLLVTAGGGVSLAGVDFRERGASAEMARPGRSGNGRSTMKTARSDC